VASINDPITHNFYLVVVPDKPDADILPKPLCSDKIQNRETNKYKTISANPGRATDQTTEITSMEMRLLIGNHIRLHISEGSIRLMLYALIKCLNNILLKIRTARKSLNNRYRLHQNKQHALWLS